jgi:acyl carrier protein
MGEREVPGLIAMFGGGPDHAELAEWLVTALGETLQTDPRSIRRDVPLWEYGVDSLVAATLIAEVEDALGVWVDPGEVPPGITLDELAAIVLESAQLAAEEQSDVA